MKECCLIGWGRVSKPGREPRTLCRPPSATLSDQGAEDDGYDADERPKRGVLQALAGERSIRREGVVDYLELRGAADRLRPALLEPQLEIRVDTRREAEIRLQSGQRDLPPVEFVGFHPVELIS